MEKDKASSKRDGSQETRHIEVVHPDYRPRRYCGGLRGSALMQVITMAGGIGFLLFGYDQGVLSVWFDSFLNSSKVAFSQFVRG